MGGTTPKPKGERRRRNKDALTPERHLVADRKVRGPVLPKRPPKFGKADPWHPQTVAWWDTWRKSPQAKDMGKTDWDFLLDTAVLHHAFWCGDRKMAAELRLRVAKFGATPQDRLNLRFEVESEATGKKAETPKKVDEARTGRVLSLVVGLDSETKTG